MKTPTPPEVVLAAASLVMTILMTVFATLYWMKVGEFSVMESELTAAKASSRKAWQKVYDMEEGRNEELEAAEGRASIELWKVTAELETCRKGK